MHTAHREDEDLLAGGQNRLQQRAQQHGLPAGLQCWRLLLRLARRLAGAAVAGRVVADLLQLCEQAEDDAAARAACSAYFHVEVRSCVHDAHRAWVRGMRMVSCCHE